jgi:hypothetical protein
MLVTAENTRIGAEEGVGADYAISTAYLPNPLILQNQLANLPVLPAKRLPRKIAVSVAVSLAVLTRLLREVNQRQEITPFSGFFPAPNFFTSLNPNICLKHLFD